MDATRLLDDRLYELDFDAKLDALLAFDLGAELDELLDLPSSFSTA
jgi:hypothetical protein